MAQHAQHVQHTQHAQSNTVYKLQRAEQTDVHR